MASLMHSWGKSRPYVLGVLGGITGIILVLVLMHLYTDHQNLHGMLTYLQTIAAQQQQQQKAAGAAKQ